MALSNREKQAAWRARQADNKDRIAKLEREVAKLREAVSNQASNPSVSNRAPVATGKVGGADEKKGGLHWFLDEAKKTIALQRAKITKLEKQLATALAAGPRADGPLAPPLTRDEKDRRIQAQQTEIRNLKLHLRHAADHHQKEIEAWRKPAMRTDTFNAIVRCLHSDSARHVTAKERDEACGLLTEWKQSQGKPYKRR